jgi:hypothetical protein
MVVAIPDDETRASLDDLRQHVELVGVGRSYREVGDDPGPANPHVHPETVEGLLEERVFAESGLSAESTAAVGSSEEASRQGERVCQSEHRVVGSEGEKLLPEELLDLPEVGSLPSEGSTVCTSPRVGNHCA